MARVTSDPRALLIETFAAALTAANPEACVRLNLPPRPAGRVVVIACGKAAPAMLRGLVEWGEVSGVAVTTAGQTLPTVKGIRWLEAPHPLPDGRSVAAGRAMLEAVRDLTSDDLVLCLISGGSSALCCVPNQIALEEKIALSKALLHSGASIQDINTVRKHLSGIKGGRLALAARPARLEALIVSDVVGDDPSAIGSGMTAPDATTVQDAIGVLRRYSIPSPSTLTETPKPNHPIFRQVTNRVILSNRVALQAARRVLEAHGWRVAHVDDGLTGDSRVAAIGQAALAKESGTAVLSGGETTVQVSSAGFGPTGRGGRNLEFLLQLVILNAKLYALSADSDGIDGSSDAAGAVVTPDSLHRALALHLEPLEFQRRNDAHGFFAALGDLVVTGPTGTNVNDIRVILKP